MTRCGAHRAGHVREAARWDLEIARVLGPDTSTSPEGGLDAGAEVQRRAAEVGCRAGEKGARGEPRKLNLWRSTAERGPAAGRRGDGGGKVRPWKDRLGESELYTETAEPPMLLPANADHVVRARAEGRLPAPV